MRFAMWTLVAAAALGLAVACPPAHADGPPPPPTLPYLGVADLNDDLSLDGIDFGLFFQDWSAFHAGGTLTARSDFDVSGTIDRLDALKFIEEWLNVQMFNGLLAAPAAQ